MKRTVFIGIVMMLGCTNPGEQVASKTDLEDVKNTPMSVPEFVAWNDDVKNNQTKVQQVGEFTYTLTHIPAEYMAMQELGGDANKKAIDSVKENYSELMYFRLRIQAEGVNQELLKYNLLSAAQYEERVKYCSFGITNDLKIENPGEIAVPCGLSNYERSFDVAPFITIMMGFSNDDIYSKDNTVTVTFDDHLFDKGLIKFTYAKDELEAIPQITN